MWQKKTTPHWKPDCERHCRYRRRFFCKLMLYLCVVSNLGSTKVSATQKCW